MKNHKTEENDNPIQLKMSYIDGLREVVLDEISKYSGLKLKQGDKENLYFDFIPNFKSLKSLKSILRIYVVSRNTKFNPFFISEHKSIIGNLLDIVLRDKTEKFNTFKISCAGEDSKEVRKIIKHIKETYKLTQKEDADIKIHIIKVDDIWEVGIQLTKRPLSTRSYKVENITGGINPTIAYTMNYLANLSLANSYLNIFSGSGTLLIEAQSINPKLKLLGFDINKKTISLAIQNIKKAGLIKFIQLKALDIFDKPDLGKFDVITSDLPFGMTVSKGEDLGKLYKCFVSYCEDTLNPNGRLVVYTNEHEILEKILNKSKFKIIKTLDLKFLTSVNAYMYPKVFVCELGKGK